jgi:dihydrofolate reductase
VAELIFSTLSSLDGFVADEDGRFDWAQPDEEVHAFVNDLSRPIGTFLLGRRTYEVLTAWETIGLAEEPSVIRDFAGIWRAADKIVYSRTLETVSTARTRLEREFDAETIRGLKASAERQLGIGGPGLAAHAFAAGLVDECQLFLAPVVVGGGTRALPDGVRLELDLLGARRFGNGTVFLRYRRR